MIVKKDKILPNNNKDQYIEGVQQRIIDIIHDSKTTKEQLAFFEKRLWESQNNFIDIALRRLF
jgi:hypothetical protein